MNAIQMDWIKSSSLQIYCNDYYNCSECIISSFCSAETHFKPKNIYKTNPTDGKLQKKLTLQ